MTASIPSTQTAYVVNGAAGAVKSGVAIPKLGSGQILVKNEAVAINPTDWKHIDLAWGVDGAIAGCDVAGTVVAIGDNVSGFALGDQVFGLVSGVSVYTPENGGFAEYSALYADRTFKAPTKFEHANVDRLQAGAVNTWEGAASLPVGLITALIGFVHWAKIPVEYDPKYADKYFLVWGGASSLGQIVIQLAKKVGFRVITTASKHNFDLVKELGVERAFDYHDEDVADQIASYVGDNLTHAYDTITEGNTTLDVYSVLSKNLESVLLTSLVFDSTTIKEVNVNVKTIGVPLAYLAVDKKKRFGVDGEVVCSPEGLFKHAIDTIKYVNEQWSKDASYIRHIPIKTISGGLEMVPQALDYVRSGKNSGLKVVVRL